MSDIIPDSSSQMEVVDPLKCVQCHKYLLDEPMQCSCGDRLCTPCYNDLSRGKTSFLCPGCGLTVEVKKCFRDKAVSAELKETPIKCPHFGCTWEGLPNNYLGHINNCLFASCSLQSDKKKISSQDDLNECEYKNAGCHYLGSSKDLIRHLESNITYHMKLMLKTLTDIKQTLMKNTQESTRVMHNLKENGSELALMVQTLQATTYNGTFIWKIPESQRRRHEAKIGKTISLYSAPFYTSRQGYKVCLRLYMDGDGCGKNTHLSFFVTIMKGEYDALLQWPFRHTVTLTLLDQEEDQHIAHCFVPDSSAPTFQRPQDEMNIASGCPMFAPLAVLSNPAYVKDDTMFLKCSIST